jgi:hypothetical protein
MNVIQKRGNLVIAIYSHPEFYPPTLNAVQELSKQFDKIYILSRNVFKSGWDYPSNVNLITYGRYMPIRESEQIGKISKAIGFFSFTYHLFKLIIYTRPRLIQVCDSIPLFSILIIGKFILRNTKLWYHNHDIIEIDKLKRYSIGWFAAKYEFSAFKLVDIFTLPSEDRRKYFPLETFNGEYYFLPNYPSIEFYNQFQNDRKLDGKELKLIFQGSIGPGHGFEEIIELLNVRISGFNLSLHLKGFISNTYRERLVEISNNFGVHDKLFFYDVTPYKFVPLVASSCHIGIGIHTGENIMESTLGTSSNKIYEYSALGLPVLIYDNVHFRGVLGDQGWVEFTDLKKENLIFAISQICKNYNGMSTAAKEAFENQLNYECYFNLITIF